jgi:tetratricopeptide (TPR) repeat protein
VTALLALDRLPDAIEACEKHKTLAERADDVVEVYLSTYQLATLKWTLEELVAAAALFAEAVSSAQSMSNNGLDAFARLGLTGVLSAGGRTDDAFAQAFRAFDISRTEALDDESLASTVVDRFADLFGRTDRRYADTLYAEARALAPVADDSQLALDQRIRYVNILRTSGQVRRARRVLEAAKERAREETAELLLEDALTQEISGSPDPAIDLYDRIVAFEESGAPPFVVAAAYANRAQQVALRGEWERSFADLDAAGERWRTTGYDRLRGLIEVWRASILRRSGAVSKAAPALAAAEELPLPESAGYLADYFEARAGLHEASARWADAGSDYGAAFERRDSVGDVAGAAQAASDAARTCARGGRWSDAARWAQAATTAWESAAEADAYEPDTSIRAADEENARGVALMFGSRREPDQARELFESALARVPDHRWYALNLATACAACREWTAAADALERFLDGAPAYLQDSDLFYRLADYRINRAEDLERRGDPAAALDAYARARASLADDGADGRLLIVANRLGEAYLRLDRLDLALQEFQKGLSLAQMLGSDPAAAVFERRLAIGAALEGDADRATGLALSSFARSDGARWTGFWTLVQEGSLAPPVKRDVLRRVLRNLAMELKNGGEMDRFESTISIGQPPDWAAKESVTLSDPSGRANVIVSIEPVPVGTTSQEYADAIGEQFREEEFAEFHELAVTETELTDGGSAILRRFSWTPSESAPVTQMQLYRVDGARGLTATATTSSASFSAIELELEQVLLSVAVGSTRMPAPTSD